MRRLLAGAVVALTFLPSSAAGQPVPVPEVVAETPVIRPTIPAPADSVGTSSARVPAAAGSTATTAALDRTG